MNVNVKVVSRLWSAFLYMLRLGITFSTWMGTLFFFWSLMSSPPRLLLLPFLLMLQGVLHVLRHELGKGPTGPLC
jgi:hypothetical protein